MVGEITILWFNLYKKNEEKDFVDLRKVFRLDMRLFRKRLVFILLFALSGMLGVYAGGKRALLIGISTYPTDKYVDFAWSSIHGANDVELLSKTLHNKGFKIKRLLNERATAKNIRKSLNALCEETMPGDVVYIHFSGHGQSYEDFSGDEQDGWDEAIVPYDAKIKYDKEIYDGSAHILDDELEQYLLAIRAKAGEEGMVYVVLDACHMGGASRGEDTEDEICFVRGSDMGFSPSGKVYAPPIDKRGTMPLEVVSGSADIYVLEACRAYQTNAEIRQEGVYYGPLSFYINQVIKETDIARTQSWIEKVRALMERDKRLIRQNMVIEKSR